MNTLPPFVERDVAVDVRRAARHGEPVLGERLDAAGRFGERCSPAACRTRGSPDSRRRASAGTAPCRSALQLPADESRHVAVLAPRDRLRRAIVALGAHAPVDLDEAAVCDRKRTYSRVGSAVGDRAAATAPGLARRAPVARSTSASLPWPKLDEHDHSRRLPPFRAPRRACSRDARRPCRRSRLQVVLYASRRRGRAPLRRPSGEPAGALARRGVSPRPGRRRRAASAAAIARGTNFR